MKLVVAQIYPTLDFEGISNLVSYQTMNRILDIIFLQLEPNASVSWVGGQLCRICTIYHSIQIAQPVLQSGQ